MGRQGSQRRAARHSDVAIFEEHRADHVDDAVGALDVRTDDADLLALPFHLVAWKERDLTMIFERRSGKPRDAHKWSGTAMQNTKLSPAESRMKNSMMGE